MNLLLARHMWGVDLPPEIAFPRFAARGYAAIESPVNAHLPGYKELIAQHGLKFIPMIFTAGDSVSDHLASFRKQVKEAIDAGAIQVTAHSGRDAWSAADSVAFYREIEKIEADLPVKVGHETHRGRVFFNPWITRDILQQCPAIKLTCDLSHWVCVAENMNWDDAAGSIMKLVADRVIHLHSRVGYEEGPQVPDPSAAEYARNVDQHFAWWKQIWIAQKARGDVISSVTPEFGPPGYLHTLPHTNVPVADLEKVCDWMADRVKAAFNQHVV